MAKKKESVEQTVRNIRRKTREQYSSEEKIRIVLEGLERGEKTVAELCRREGIAERLVQQMVQRIPGNWEAAASRQYQAPGGQPGSQ